MFEYIGNVHVHTLCSDGTADHATVAAVAAQEGLDFVITTDHTFTFPVSMGGKMHVAAVGRRFTTCIGILSPTICSS